MTRRLLPPRSTPLERALADLAGHIEVPDVSGLWNAQTCPEHLLPWLAWAVGVREWSSDWTVEVKRLVIASQMAIPRRRGTVWAVRHAITTLGYAGAQIIEGMPVIQHNGELVRGGYARRNGASRWAHFRVVLDLGETEGVSAAANQRLIARIEGAKPVRSVLQEISYTATISDTVAMQEQTAIAAALGLTDVAAPGPIRTGYVVRNGVTLRPAPCSSMALALATTVSDQQVVGTLARAALITRDGSQRHGPSNAAILDAARLSVGITLTDDVVSTDEVAATATLAFAEYAGPGIGRDGATRRSGAAARTGPDALTVAGYLSLEDIQTAGPLPRSMGALRDGTCRRGQQQLMAVDGLTLLVSRRRRRNGRLLRDGADQRQFIHTYPLAA